MRGLQKMQWMGGLLVVLLALLMPAQAYSPQWEIAPNRVGMLTDRSTPDDMIKIYGKANVKKGVYYLGEGYCFHASIIYPDDLQRQFKIVWTEGDNPRPFMMAWVRPWDKVSTSLWHTPQGLTIGSTLPDVAAMNQGPFTFFGLDWDYGGRLISWNKGVLARQFNERLVVDFALTTKYPVEVDSQMLGDVELRSDQKFAAIKHLVVRRINLYFEPTPGKPFTSDEEPEEQPCELLQAKR